MTEFLAMGGYAPFVWTSYAVAGGILLGLLAVSLRSLRVRQADADALEAARPRRDRPARTGDGR